MDALLIIDMQVASFAAGDKHDVAGTVDRINQLAAAVRHRAGRVIFIQHDGTAQEDLAPHTPGWALLPGLDRRPEDVIVRKTLNDAFARTTLDRELTVASARTIGVTGWATDYCVDSTIRSAVSRGLAVIVPSDAHTVSDRPHLNAKQIIEHHNHIWAGLIATPAVLVMPTEALLSRGG